MKMKNRLLALALALTLVWSSLPVTALADSAPAPAPVETAVEAPAKPESEQPEAPAAPEVSAAPEPTAEPPETPAPEPSPTASPDQTPTPEPSASPVPPATPAPAASPEPTASPVPAPLAANGVLRASSPTQTEDSVASVTKGEATTYYDSLDDALDAVANADATVKLLKDAKIDNSYSFYGDVTIEGGGYTVEGYGVWTSWQGKLTLRNIQSPDLSVYAFYGGTVLIEGDSSVDLATTFGGSITLTSGRVSTFYIMGESSTATVNGGTIEYLLNEGTVTVTGGTIEVMGNEGTITVLPSQENISLTLDSSILEIGETATLTLSYPGVSGNGTIKTPTVTWESSDVNVATVDNGTVTGISEGTATITATLTMEETEYKVSVSATVTVVAADTVALVTTGSTTTPYNNFDDALDAVKDSGGTVTLLKNAESSGHSFYGDVTIEGGGYKVESNNAWSSYGNLTLRNIQAPDLDLGLDVYAHLGASVQIENSSVALATSDNGGSITLTRGHVVTFDVDDVSSTATVNGSSIEYLNNNGTVTVTGGTIGRVTANTGTITVLPTAEDQLAVNLSAAIVAVDASVNASVVVNNPNVTLPAGFTPAAPSVTWSSSNEEVATVDENGTVTGVSEGTATITAKLTVEGTEYEVAVSVTVVTAGTVALVTTGGTTTSCSNFDDALNAVENAGGAVTLLQDVETSRNHDFNANVTIDGGNHSVSANPTWCTWDVYSEITLQNIVVNLDVFAYSSAQMQIENSSMADLYVCENASVCIKGGKVSSLSNDNSGTVTLTGGTITSLNNFDSGTVKITSGTISELNNRDTGTVTVTGGEITYLYNKKDGTVTVTAGTISDVSGTITVLPTAADQLSVSPSPLSVAVGATINASVVVNNDDVTLPDGFTPDAPSVSWLSRDPSIAAIDTDGTVSGLKVGTATIAAIYDTPEGGTFTATAEVTVQYPAPSPGIDYKNEQLTGLVENTTYKISVDGTANTYTADGNGYIKIQEGWFGKTLTIVRMEGTEAASLAGSKEIPARPAAPGAKGQNVTASGWTDGKITGLDAGKTYEYSTDKTNWKAVDLGATEITRLPEDTYYLRYPATDAAFASAVQTITIGSNAPTYIVTIPETIAVNGEAVAVSASNVCLPAGGKLQVAITGSGDNGAFLLSDGKTDTVEYAVTCDDQPVTPGGTILTVEPGGGNPQEPQSAVADLAFTLPRGAEPAYAGTYSGHVTFTVTTTP